MSAAGFFVLVWSGPEPHGVPAARVRRRGREGRRGLRADAHAQSPAVHSLMSGNLMDVCPVGAITTRDYRFKSRPWDNPNAADTICTDCAKGCNTTAWIKAKPEWAKGSQLIRFTPRPNPEVNGYWMCDIGRFDYHWIEGDSRLRQPLIRIGDVQQPVGWHEVLSKLPDRLAGKGTVGADGTVTHEGVR